MADSDDSGNKKISPTKATVTGLGGAGMMIVIYLLNQMNGMFGDVKTDFTNAIKEVQTELGPIKESLVKITTELDIVSPRDLRKDFSQLPTKADVQVIMKSHAPWVIEKQEWVKWRATVDAKFKEHERRLDNN